MDKALRIKVYQPNAHFRLPFAYQRRLTYPLPPYSTVIGLLSNVLGIGYDVQSELFDQLKATRISVSGYFDSKITENIWFRNIAVDRHTDRFHKVNKRFLNGRLEHIGGQALMAMDVLHNAHFVFHFYNDDTKFLDTLKANFEKPNNRLDVLHLGRAEDWLVIEDLDYAEIGVAEMDGNFNHFFWLPEKEANSEKTNASFEQITGLTYRLPTFCHVQDYQETGNKNGSREFEYLPTKLNDGAIMNARYFYDVQEGLPVFFANFD
jgi:CRISPR-associated protein Cas5t